MQNPKICAPICFSKLLSFRYAWCLGGAAMLTYPVLRYSPVLCGHWKGGVWWALNWLRLKVLGIVGVLWFIWVLHGFTCFKCFGRYFYSISACFCMFCVGVYDHVVAHCPKCFLVFKVIQNCRNGRSIHFATSTRLWPSHRRSSTAACLHFSLSQSPVCPAVDLNQDIQDVSRWPALASITASCFLFSVSPFLLGCHIDATLFVRICFIKYDKQW